MFLGSFKEALAHLLKKPLLILSRPFLSSLPPSLFREDGKRMWLHGSFMDEMDDLNPFMSGFRSGYGREETLIAFVNDF